MSELIAFQELKTSNKLPSPQGVMLNVIRLCQREQVALPELVRQIQVDPVLTGRLIKIANVVNPIKSRKIASVSTDVLILVGVHTVRQLALGISLVTTYQSGACAGFNYGQFWSRSLAMACAAQALAERIRIAPVAEVFTCGLLAGIGQLSLAMARPEPYSSLLALHRATPPESRMQAEVALFGINHLHLAALMMADWGIPRLFNETVRFHETPDSSGFAGDSRQQRLVQLLHVAARIADLCIAGDAQREAGIAVLLDNAVRIDLSRNALAAAINQTSREWGDSGAGLQVTTRPLPLLAEEE
jgi:HD-like signal output (HDOD) protein